MTLLKSTEIAKADITPFLSIFQLALQAVVYFIPALFVNLGTDFLPDSDKVLSLADTVIVVPLHLFPECSSAVHATIPWYPMEPEQVAFGTGVNIVVE